jgi:hypothetical protein
MAIITRSNETPLLRDGVDYVQAVNKENRIKLAYEKIFSKRRSHRASEIIVETRGTGLAGFTGEGAPGNVGSMGIQTTTVVTHAKKTLGLIFTEEALEDNLYDDQFPRVSDSLTESFRQSSEYDAMSMFNNAFNAASPIGDGQALCSNAHPIYNGTVSNFAGLNDLTPTSLEDMIITMQLFKDPAGLYKDYTPELLLVPLQQQFNVAQILKSLQDPFTGNNAINPLHSMLPKGIVMSRYLTNPGSCFLISDYPDAFIHYIKKPLEVNVNTDPSTGNVSMMGSLRESFVAANFRGVVGLQGS